jgi:hypothetical protein
MNTDDRFIRQLESYLDDYEGATPLPERVRDAVRAALPQTKQTGAARGPVRYLSMTLNKVGPVALAAAAGLLAIVAGIYLFGGRGVGGPDATPSSVPSATESSADSSSPSAGVGCAETETRVTGSSVTTLEIDWCSARAGGENIPIPFTMAAPPAWLDQVYGEVDSLWLRPAGGGAILFAVLPTSSSVDELVSDIRGREGYALANEATADVDGAEGVVFDLTLAEGASSGTTEPLFRTPTQPWLLSAGNVHRVWIVDRNGEITMIATGEQHADALAEALTTLTWGD